ncbi:alpha/beta fold hydrolase [Paractinoplanes toevensis]|uniref:Alpha/beta hydrolase n=1 Tax=Paractinoplanes toevensis TaxID=571911 RepID=A0A920BR04_9ACTN|nr:alpha/beta fold hydrolase [Actinoplanes toevensis]GIM97992.1 alpha/beta hydrolase [Actinoplanes toevensis]
MTISMRAGDPPLIVFIAALGHGGDVWKPVIDRLPGAAVLTYDRPACGDAPPRHAPNPPLPFSAFADELAELLDGQGVTEPFVLVGHSIGGSIARLFAQRHPERVAGMVFLEASLPQSLTWPETDFLVDGDDPGATTVDVIAGHVELLQVSPLDVPAVVVTRRRHWWIPEYRYIPHPAIDDLWHVSQQLLAREWRAPLIVAENSGHHLPVDVPDLVAYAVNAVAVAVRTGDSLALDAHVVAELGGTALEDSP